MHKQLQEWLAAFEVEIEQKQLEAQFRFLDELLHWNKRINLTSITDYRSAVEKHLLDSLLLLPYLPETALLLDMGSGGGLPGLPLAIARPQLQITSVDSVGKKISFQKHIKRLLCLDNFTPVQSRIESFEQRQKFDFITARAMSCFDNLLPWASPHLAEGGRVLAMKGPGGGTELQESLAVTDSGFKVTTQQKYQLPESRSERQLIILTKTSH
jgi:16S rRNA (guanine527-N7)-methyltransferase